MSSSSTPTLHLFPRTRRGVFTRRLNRFVIECSVDGSLMRAYLPNPGRLRELLLPGRTLYLAENAPSGKYRYTAVAVVRDGRPVLLHTHMANRAVQWLLIHRAIPELKDATVVRPEVTVDRSRFDFLLEKDGMPFLLEVKSCTLFEDDIALFPDAVTDRGRRHLLELAESARQGTPGGVVILINWPRTRYFLPDYHTDLEFARAFLEVKKDIAFIPIAVEWSDTLSLIPSVRRVAIPWALIEREAADSGSYVLILRLSHDETIEVGKLGSLHFRRGYYLYVGSAKKNLTRRINRHLRKRKNFHWHIDYLRDRADYAQALAIRSSDTLECALAKAIEKIAHWKTPAFGSSDCGCDTHLFGMTHDPAQDPAFVEILQYFRIGRLREELQKIKKSSRAEPQGRRD